MSTFKMTTADSLENSTIDLPHRRNLQTEIKEQLTFCLNLFYVVTNYMFQIIKFNDWHLKF